MIGIGKGERNENILSKGSVSLRPPEPSDADLLYSMENDSSVWKVSNTLAPYSRFQIEQYIINAPSDVAGNRQLRLMIQVSGENGKMKTAGAIDLFDIDLFHRRAGTGIMILGPYRRQGIARQALGILIGYTFNVLGLHQLHCSIDPANKASIGLFRKAGFKKTGIRYDWHWGVSGWSNEWVFQLIRNESKVG